jgi:hypothetical protein
MMNNEVYSIPRSVAHFYQQAEQAGIYLDNDLSIYQGIRFFICTIHRDCPESWAALEQEFINAIMAGIPEPVQQEDAVS